jgi:HD-like signal output (HDOD) protein
VSELSPIQENLKQRVLEGIEELPGFSPAVQEIITISNDLNSTPRQLLELVKTEPVLTAKILKLVNSAFFSLPNKITSLNQALVLLGFNAIKNIALSTEMLKLSVDKSGALIPQYRKLWEHMVSVAAISRLIAKESDVERKKHEEYFVGGLIHDLGDFLLMRFLPQEHELVYKLAKERGQTYSECSKMILGFTGSEMGALLAEQWKLPVHLQQVVGGMEPKNHRGDNLDKVIYLADQISKLHGMGSFDEGQDIEINPSDLEDIGLSTEFIESSNTAIFKEIRDAQVFLAA